MTVEEFFDATEKVYNNLPQKIKDRFEIAIEEEPTELSIESNALGYWVGLTPNVLHICYWSMHKLGKDTEQDISNVIHHEFEHHLMMSMKHSEHYD